MITDMHCHFVPHEFLRFVRAREEFAVAIDRDGRSLIDGRQVERTERAAEAAALAASKLMGRGDEKAADQAAVDAMRSALNTLDIDGTVVIGEGERDEAPMLYIGEKVGQAAKGVPGLPEVDIAVDPLEGTNLCATGANNAIAVLAAASKGGLLHAPDLYMEKLVVGPRAKHAVSLDRPVKDNLKSIAKALDRGDLDLASLVEMTADEAHAALTAIHGIGPWTADIYLLFCLGHSDAWPAGDLAVQEAMRIGLGLKARPTVKQMAPLAEPWRPLRGAAAHLWWAYYHAVKKREGVMASAAAAGKATGAATAKKPAAAKKKTGRR